MSVTKQMAEKQAEQILICFKGLCTKDTVNIGNVQYGNGAIVRLPAEHAKTYINVGLAFPVVTEEDLKEAWATQALLIKNDQTRKAVIAEAKAVDSETGLNKLQGMKGGAK